MSRATELVRVIFPSFIALYSFAAGCSEEPTQSPSDAGADVDVEDDSGARDAGDAGEGDADEGDSSLDADLDERVDADEDSGGFFEVPPPESILAPAVYDCRAAASPPERASVLPLGCFADPTCSGLIVVAHRGSSFFAPENSLSAVRSAIALGVDMVEIDTRLTSDGEVVLLHDSSIDRTTEGLGDVEELTAAEVRSHALLEAERHPEDADFSCEIVPTLAEALELCRGRIDVMLDMKEGPAEAASIIRDMGMTDQIVMLASTMELTAAREAAPELLVMIRPREQSEIQPMWDSFVPPPTVVHIDGSFNDDETIGVIHDLGAKVLNDMWGADGLAAMLGDFSLYATEYERGLDIQQSELPFFALWSVGRGSPP